MKFSSILPPTLKPYRPKQRWWKSSNQLPAHSGPTRSQSKYHIRAAAHPQQSEIPRAERISFVEEGSGHSSRIPRPIPKSAPDLLSTPSIRHPTLSQQRAIPVDAAHAQPYDVSPLIDSRPMTSATRQYGPMHHRH